MILVPRVPKLNAGVPVDDAVHAWESRPWDRAQKQIAEAVHRRAMFERIRRGEPVMGQRRVILPQRHRRPLQQAMLHAYHQGGAGRVHQPVAGADDADPDFSSVVLLMHFDGTNGQSSTTDSSSYARSIGQVGGPTLSSTQAKFGATSYGVGTDNYWTATNTTELQMGTGLSTHEGWFYVTTSNSLGTWFTKGINTTGGLLCGINATSITTRRNGTDDVTGTFSSILNTWVHAAHCRDASNWALVFTGGTQRAEQQLSYNNNDTSVAAVGQSVTSSFSFLGFMDEVRVTKGVCRYPRGTSYTPPTAAFPNS